MKHTVTKEVAESLNAVLVDYDNDVNDILISHVEDGTPWGGRFAALNGISIERLARYLIEGYEPEASFEEKVESFIEWVDNLVTFDEPSRVTKAVITDAINRFGLRGEN